ncbi:MAG: FixH family protein [Pseudomonadota bacterium]
MSELTTLRETRPLTGRHVALMLALFFGTIVAVNLTMAMYATRTWSGLLVANTYVESQRYNAVIAKDRAERALGWTVGADVKGGELVLTLTDDDGRPLRPTALSAVAGRAVNEAEDVTLGFTKDGPGYRADAALAPGAWNVAILVEQGGDEATFRLRLVVGDER